MRKPSLQPSPFGFRFGAPLALGSILYPINSTMLTTALVPGAYPAAMRLFRVQADRSAISMLAVSLLVEGLLI